MPNNILLYKHNKLLSGGGNVKPGLYPTATAFFGNRHSINFNRAPQTLSDFGTFIDFDGSIETYPGQKYVITTTNINNNTWGYSYPDNGTLSPTTITGKKISSVGQNNINVDLIIKHLEITPTSLILQVYNSTDINLTAPILDRPGRKKPIGPWFQYINFIDNQDNEYFFYPYDNGAAIPTIGGPGYYTSWIWNSTDSDTYANNIQNVYNLWNNNTQYSIFYIYYIKF